MTQPRTVERTFGAFLPNDDDPNMQNPMHSTEGGQKFGFRGALIGGVAVWGWSVPLIIEALGERWMDHGWAEFNFRQPAYPGDEMGMRIEPEGDAWKLTMSNQEGVVCVNCNVGLGDAPWLGEFVTPTRIKPEPQPDPWTTLQLGDTEPIGKDWAPMLVETSVQNARDYATRSLHTDDPMFVGGHPRLHPSWLAGLGQRTIRHNYKFGPMIHTRTRMQMLAPIYAGETLTAAGHLLEVYERRGHHIVHSDVLVLNEAGTTVARLSHWTIFRVAPVEEREGK